jgi:hypothetical protein
MREREGDPNLFYPLLMGFAQQLRLFLPTHHLFTNSFNKQFWIRPQPRIKDTDVIRTQPLPQSLIIQGAREAVSRVLSESRNVGGVLGFCEEPQVLASPQPCPLLEDSWSEASPCQAFISDGHFLPKPLF